MSAYQDQWAHGCLIRSGYRECAHRYEIVREFCARQFHGPFTVCDIGANECYFGIRLTEDYPGCAVLAFEYYQFEQRHARLRASGATRVLLLQRRLTIPDLQLLARFCRFDLVLAFSVIHHLGGVFADTLEALTGLGRHVLAEFALNDSRSRRTPEGYRLPQGAEVLGYGQSHLKRAVRRPIVRLSGSSSEVHQ